jgi:hypothetical protein
MKAFARPETLSLTTSILLTHNHIISYAGYCADCFYTSNYIKNENRIIRRSTYIIISLLYSSNIRLIALLLPFRIALI